MGRPTFYRQRIRTEAASVEAKTLLAFLTSEIRARREISLEEAEMVARDTLDFIEGHLLSRGLGQIELPAIAGRTSFMRRGRREQPEKLVAITVFSDDDAELMADFGVAVMVLGRMARAIEEAWEQDVLLDEKRLCLLWPLSHKGIRERLSKLWDQGCLLPLAGMSRKMRERLTTPRAVLAVGRYLRETTRPPSGGSWRCRGTSSTGGTLGSSTRWPSLTGRWKRSLKPWTIPSR